MNRRPWKRRAALPAAQTRRLAVEKVAQPEPVPPLVPPDDDREFVMTFLPGARLRPEAA